ncbi:Tyrosine-protein phosphatase non-receptor type 6 [Apiospora rasikravindrae]|uniref:Tyrosine-protein phosphatase non-receptor type 6 n=1 Tax=Apiospora rasikravindrae TaxID=990691 RepID=A0ABR1RPN4_9PEZI
MPSLAAGPPSYTALPNIDSIKSELETTASRILSGPHKGRYSLILVLLVCWQDDMDANVAATVDELAEVLGKMYHYTIEIIRIPPSSSDGCKNSSRWLSRTINDFIDHSDTRDVLKIVYYNGGSFLDENREMILASVEDMERTSAIRWNGLQQTLEEACSDTLAIIDAPFYPSFKMVRQKGVLEIIAASTSQEQYNLIGRNSLTRALTEQLRSRISQRPSDALSAAEFHSKLLALYPRIVHERHLGLDAVARTPSPLHLQMSGNWRLPSITLAPLQFVPPKAPLFSPEANGGPQLNLSIRLTDDTLNIESWASWLRMLPEGIKDVKVEGPYHTFR